MNNITLCAHCGKSDVHSNMNLFRGEFVCNKCLKDIEQRPNEILGKCEHCNFPVFTTDERFETENELFLHKICYPKMVQERMKEWKWKELTNECI